MKLILKHTIFLLCLVFSACDLTGKSTGANDGLARGVLDVQGILQADGTLKGTGQVLSTQGLGQVRSARSFHLQFKLEDGGSVQLITYANTNLLEGVGIEFIREGSVLSARFFGSGVELLITDRLAQYNAAQVLNFMVDVHNDHDDAAHIFLWPYLGDSASLYGPQNSLVNSDFFQLPILLDGFDFPDWLDQAVKGNGAFWGLDLKDAEVMIYRMGAAKDQS
jgi:hypothetical protein